MARHLALFVGNTTFDDDKFPALNTPGNNAQDLARLVAQYGDFDILDVLVDAPVNQVLMGIHDLYQKAQKGYMTLLYYSGHGTLDDHRQLFLIAKDTRYDYLLFTGISENHIQEAMRRSRSQHRVVILDCCYSGAFIKGHMGGPDPVSFDKLKGEASVILTSSSAVRLQIEEEGDRHSLFTKHLIQGIESGDADKDQDGLISIEELFEYADTGVQRDNREQTPMIYLQIRQAKIHLTKNPKSFIHRLPDKIDDYLKSPHLTVRMLGMKELNKLLNDPHQGIAHAARKWLEMLNDPLEAPEIRNYAIQALGGLAGAFSEDPGESNKNPSPFIYDKPVPPSQFIGHEQLIQECQDYLTQTYKTSIAISGDHGLGKTSLLKYIAHRAEQEQWGQGKVRAIFSYIDCQAIASSQPKNFWQPILEAVEQQQLHSSLGQQIKRLLSKPTFDLIDLHYLFGWVRDQQFSIILLLDNFAAIIDSIEVNQAAVIAFLSDLNALSRQPDQAPGLMIASQMDLDSLCADIVRGNPGTYFYRDLVFKALSPFTPQEMNAFFEDSLGRTTVTFDQADRRFISRIAGAHPLLLQMASHHLFLARRLEHPIGDIYRKVSDDFLQSAHPYFSLLWDDSAPLDRALLLLIILQDLLIRSAGQTHQTQENLQLLFRKYERNLRGLVRRVLVQNLENNYQIVSSAFAWWIVDKIGKEREEDLLNQYRSIREEVLSQLWQIFRQFGSQLSFDARAQNISVGSTGLNSIQAMLQKYLSSERYIAETASQFQDTTKLVPARYEIQDVLGRGGSGVVYKALDTTLKRLVAIKAMHDQLGTGTGDRPDSLLKEAQATSGLEHSNIIKIHDAMSIEGQVFIIMEYLNGYSLAQLIEQEKRLPLDRTLFLLEQAAAALDYAHSQEVLHRDIKPGNLMITDHDKLILMDFGIAKSLGDESTTLGIKGTVKYMSPEQVNQEQLGNPSDLFSLAVVAFEMLTGTIPWEGVGLLELMMSISKSAPQPLTDFGLSGVSALDPVFRKAFARNPAERYQSGKAFVEALRAAH